MTSEMAIPHEVVTSSKCGVCGQPWKSHVGHPRPTVLDCVKTLQKAMRCGPTSGPEIATWGQAIMERRA